MSVFLNPMTLSLLNSTRQQLLPLANEQRRTKLDVVPCRMRIASWNVNGSEPSRKASSSVVTVHRHPVPPKTKAQQHEVDANLDGYEQFWHSRAEGLLGTDPFEDSHCRSRPDCQETRHKHKFASDPFGTRTTKARFGREFLKFDHV